MPNSKYDQVTDLLAAGTLKWDSDAIQARLINQGTFDAAHTKFSEVGATSLNTAPILGRWVTGTNFMGEPVIFHEVAGDDDYRVVLVQDIGNGDPFLLAWYDTDDDDGPLHMDSAGALIIRPVLLDPVPEGSPSTSRLWLKV